MNNATNYAFEYNVPFENDKLEKTDLLIPVMAELLPIGGMKPVVMIKFRPVYATLLLRIRNLDLAVRNMELIAIAHFSQEMKIPTDELTVIRLAS